MPEKQNYDLDERRLELLKVKLEWLLEWEVPKVEETVGPFNPTAFEAYDKRRLATVEACAALLREYSDDEIESILIEDTRDTSGMRDKWNHFRDRDIRGLLSSVPPWYAGGFGHPDHVADFEYWCKMPSFSVEELLCLSIGMNPEDFDEDRIRGLKDRKAKGELWPSLQYLVRRHVQLARAFPRSHAGRRVSPTEFLDWSARVELQSHPEFTRLLKRYNGTSSEDQCTVAGPPKTDEREIDTIAKLLTAIAIREYGYRPKSPRSPIPRQIAEISAELGLSVSNETVLAYLRRGAKFLPKDWNPE